MSRSDARWPDCATGWHDRCTQPARCGCPCHTKPRSPVDLFAAYVAIHGPLAADDPVLLAHTARDWSGADQPTLRDPAAVLRRLIDTAPVMRFDNDYPVKAVPIAELLDVLLPLIEADRERAVAEGGAEALEQAAARVPRWSPEVIAKWLRDRAAALRGSAGGAG